MHGFVSYRCFGKVWSLCSDRACSDRACSDRACSDRAVDVLGRYIATELGLNSVAT
ncbi:hypothetical protein F2Q69_00012092 [Brassica cretica]|uniref:Uncharacterized protein n=1 Tax=Brassica cretica TaxID=69181 RepID=A0A8S9R205_BRACR|nr:hypothetical protein F2Q69_00012092 [Brassica cretica]